MDRPRLQAIVAAHLPALVRFLDLDGWMVHVEYQRLDPRFCADIKVDVDYQQATLRVDMDGYEDELAVVDVLFHELAHLVLAAFDAYRELAVQLMPDPATGGADGRVEARAWRMACEHGVLALERLWRAHLRDIYLDLATRPHWGC